jgi:hypothetical protein
VALVAFAGCVPSYNVLPVRMGAVYLSKGEHCPVRFENLSFQEALAKYEQIGLITVSGGGVDELTPPMKADVEREACKMGADVLSLNASVPRMFQFQAWRHR